MQQMENPFKFGSVVDGEYFIDRQEELPRVRQIISSRNHLVLTSPRHYGKKSLVQKAVRETSRPAVFVNVQAAACAADLARLLLNRFSTKDRKPSARDLPCGRSHKNVQHSIRCFSGC